MSALPSAIGASPRNANRAVPLPQGRRGSELAMACFAIAIMAFAYAATGLGLNGHLPPGIVTYVGGFAVLVIGAHLTVRRFAPWGDPLLLPLAAVLNGLGVVMIYGLQEIGRNGNPGIAISTLTTHAALYQLIWTALGIACFVAVLALIKEARVLQRYTYTLGTLGLMLIAIPALLPSRICEIPGTPARFTGAVAFSGCAYRTCAMSLLYCFSGHFPGS
jgi:hypothetical protein